ncbi:MAG: alanine:cation symporter family protein [Clostridiales bacterium]|nr:alanine:cation symporter family protein [Candidatus Blautia equi]
MMQVIENINNAINGVVWGVPMLILMGFVGILMTILTKFFQVSHIGYWMKKTVGDIFTNKKVTQHTDDKSITPFQSLCTALAATVGTGNIVGVATAIASGGPGAVFWMWIISFFGMMTNFSENVLGIFYRRKNANDEWSGGAMYYLRDGLGAKPGMKGIGTFLAGLFAIFCFLASFGIGNMTQVNSISSNMSSAFGVPTWVTGLVVMIAVGTVVLGGLKRIASVTEKIVPFMVILYIVGSIVILLTHITTIPAAVVAIFKSAFGMKAAAGGIVGAGVRQAIIMGMKRGVFSNEAGLGSSVMVHSNSSVAEPVQQGMWGIFEVFADTIIVCTLTAVSILVSGDIDLATGTVIEGVDASNLASSAFGAMFGKPGEMFIAVAILLFAFSTVLGWSHYGSKACEFLLGLKATMVYKVIFTVATFGGAVMGANLAWDIADTLNGLMAIPNLIGVLALSGTVMAITKNYVDRRFRGMQVTPMLSAFPEIQKEQEKVLAENGD